MGGPQLKVPLKGFCHADWRDPRLWEEKNSKVWPLCPCILGKKILQLVPVSPVILQGPNRGQRVLKQRISFLGSSHTSCYLHRPLPALAATAHVVAATESKFSLSDCWAAVGGNRQIIPCHTYSSFSSSKCTASNTKSIHPIPNLPTFHPRSLSHGLSHLHKLPAMLFTTQPKLCCPLCLCARTGRCSLSCQELFAPNKSL